jgi:hypothetical protein
LALLDECRQAGLLDDNPEQAEVERLYSGNSDDEDEIAVDSDDDSDFESLASPKRGRQDISDESESF